MAVPSSHPEERKTYEEAQQALNDLLKELGNKGKVEEAAGKDA
ncbi:hypothetical protein [Seinonella peptonophila]|nr:hypothetical protein [Seinonella peptonophila]